MTIFKPKPDTRQCLVFAIIGLCCLCSNLQAQLTADFTADKTGGCPPALEVKFTNTTKGLSSAATFFWEFGNGRTSTNKDASTIFTDIKSYTVTLTVKDGAASSAKSTTISIYKLPSVSLAAANNKGCTPLPVSFTANAVAYDGASIASYLWDFGDGVTQQTNTNTISHTYTGVKTQVASVTVRDNHGCVQSGVQDNIQVLPAVKASFDADKTVLCTTAESVTFTSNSTGPGTLSYNWDFGDGKSASDARPAHTYSAKGDYKVKLTVSSSEGCSNTYELPKTVTVANFNVSFTPPAVICTGNAVNFSSSISPAADLVTWTFGDGGSRLGNTAVYSYSAANEYDVKLTARYGTCNIDAVKKVKVNQSPLLKGFVVENNGVCGAPATITMRDTSAAAVKWQWSGGTMSNSTSRSVTSSFSANGGWGLFLTITDAAGCTASANKSIELRNVTASIGYLSSSSTYGLRGCDNLTAKFNVSFSSDKIDTYQWDFGDGTPKSTEAQPLHTFSRVGFYTVTLSYVTDAGCKGTSYTTVSVYKTPVVDFSMLNTNPVCGNTPVTFNGKTNDPVDSWNWYFEGATNGVKGYGINTSYQYTREGTYSVRLVADNAGICRDTVDKTDFVTIIPPFPKISQVINTCAGTRNKVTFTETSRQTQEWRWDFGDGNTDVYKVATPLVAHEYAATGRYKVVLTAVNGACAVKDSLYAHVLLKQTPVVTVNVPEVCGNDIVRMEVTMPETYPVPGVYGSSVFSVYPIQYDKNGDAFTGVNTATEFSWRQTYKAILSGLTPGKDSIRVITTTGAPFGCRDTSEFIKLHVKGPIAAYKVTANNVCFSTPNKFVDNSELTDGVPVVLWTWTYGDGNSESFTKGPEAEHIYAVPGTYYPTLKVTDKDGCFSTSRFGPPASPVAVTTGPRANFSWSPSTIKPGNTAYFNNITTYNSYNTSYTWSFSYDGTTSSTLNPSKTYPKIGTDVVKLVARDPVSGCVDSITKRVSINTIHAAFSYTATYLDRNSCPPVLARFSNASTDYTRLKWDFGDGAEADNIAFPSHRYEKSGKYTIKLYAYDDKGGIDSTEQEIEIKGPFASFVADHTQVCGVPADIHFTATPSSDVTQITWDMADGTTQASDDKEASYTYTLPGAYTPAIIVKDALGCMNSYTLGQPFVIDTLHISFSRTPTIICDAADVKFTPAVINIAADKLNLPLTYHWDFGTGNPADISEEAYPVFRYQGIGGEKFKVHLTVTSSAGCIEEAEDSVSIVKVTKGVIVAVPEICQNETADFTGTADGPVESISWNMADNNTTINDKTKVSHQYKTGGDYEISLLMQNNGCTYTATHDLKVHSLPNVGLAAKQVLLCLGDSATLQAHNGITYEWWPATTITDAGIADPKVFPVVDTRYRVKVTDEYGCVNADSLLVKLSYPFTVTTPQELIACRGDEVMLTASGAVQYKWNGNGLNNVIHNSPVVNAQTSGVYQVVGYGNDDCFTDTADFKLTVNPVPAVSSISDTTVVAGNTVRLSTKGSADIIRYVWSPAFYLDCAGCAAPVSAPRASVNYVVNAWNQYGCKATDTVVVTLKCMQSTVFIPNTFTPNKDKRNDLFYPRGKGIRQVKSFRIYNRLGELIFERYNTQINDLSQGWDGTYMGRALTAGVFAYTSELICDAGELYLMKGTVTLLR